MSCFCIDLSAYTGVNEDKLDAWAKRFFVSYTWKKPLMFGEVIENDYKKQQLQTLMNHNLKNWGAHKTKRYCKQWISRIMPWDFAKECMAKKVFADRKIQRLAAILSLQNVGFGAWKQETEPNLATRLGRFPDVWMGQ